MMDPVKRARIFTGFDPMPSDFKPEWVFPLVHPDDPDRDAKMVVKRKAWKAECANASRSLPAWAYHRDWLNGYALEFLPAVCAAIETGQALQRITQPSWWPSMEPGRVLALRATPAAYHCLFVDEASGFWMEPVLSMQGVDLVALVEKRLGLSPAKAAWRLARICGLRKPMP